MQIYNFSPTFLCEPFVSTPNQLNDAPEGSLPVGDYIYGVVLDQYHQVVEHIYTNSIKKVILPSNQTYYLQIKKVGSSTFEGSLKFKWYKNNSQDVTVNKIAGTLRVQKIVLNDLNGKTITRKFEYKNPITGFSSGFNHGDELKPYTTIITLGNDRHCYQDSSGIVHCDNSCTGTCEKTVLSNFSGINLNSVDGKSIGYDYVKEIYVNDTQPSTNFNTLYKYSNIGDDNIQDNRISPFVPREDNSFKRGLLLEKKMYSNTSQLRKSQVNSYDFDYYFNQFAPNHVDEMSISTALKIDLVNICYSAPSLNVQLINGLVQGYGGHSDYHFNWRPYRILSAWVKMTKEETTDYYPTGNVVNTNEYFYKTDHSHIFPIKTTKTTSNSTNETIETNYFYPQDLPNEPHASDLITQNRIATPLVTQTIKNGLKLAEQKTEYAKDSSTNNLLLPKFIYANKGADPIDTNADKRITYNQYDNKGNLLEYTLENGTPVAILWGYNQTQPIAKIENAPYSAISSFVSNLQGLSNDDNDHCTTNPCTGNEQNLRIALNALRYEPALANAMITTYTYDPLIGVTSITDPKGETQYFNYDAFGRLENVKDKDGNILSENEYHYRP